MTQTINRVLVTGGAGFIGSHLTHALVAEGYQVNVLDNLVTGHLKNLDSVKDAVTFIHGDIRDENELSQAVAGCQIVFHLAAMVSVVQSVTQPLESMAINDVGTLNVLEAARNNNVQRVVLSSSSAIYGDDPQLPKIETMEPSPLSPYAVQKLTNEFYARLYHRLYGLETVCLRYFNVYGPRQDPSSPYSGVISIFMARAAEGKAPLIFGDGLQTRDFIYVGDVVQANVLAAHRDQAVGQAINVGTHQSISVNALWDKIAKIANTNAAPQHADPRPGDVVHSLSDIQKAHDLLGFKPTMGLREGLGATFDWYQHQGRHIDR